jgi:hypothetical protein
MHDSDLRTVKRQIATQQKKKKKKKQKNVHHETFVCKERKRIYTYSCAEERLPSSSLEHPICRPHGRSLEPKPLVLRCGTRSVKQGRPPGFVFPALVSEEGPYLVNYDLLWRRYLHWYASIILFPFPLPQLLLLLLLLAMLL